MAGRCTALWMRRAMEKARVLLQGQAELLAQKFVGLGVFSLVLPLVSRVTTHELFHELSREFFIDALQLSETW